MLIGSDGTGWIEFSDYELARTIGIVALALILFEGGLTSGLVEIRPVLGTAVGAGADRARRSRRSIAGLAAAWLFDIDTKQGLLIGAVLASTDGAAIFALLRNSTLRRKLARALEGESGLNDPVAVLLVLALIEFIKTPGYDFADATLLLVRQLGIGLAVGVAVGWLGVQAFRRAQLATAGLYPVASLAIAALAFGGADTLHGSGFLAVYLAGLALGSAAIPAQQTITAFHQGLAWVAQVGMFLTLGLLVFPHELDNIWLEGTVLALIARGGRAAAGRLPRHRVREARQARADRARLGRAARRGAGGARDLPGDRRACRGAASCSTSSSSPCSSRRSAGHDVRAAGRAPRRHHQRAGAPSAAGRGRHDPAARRGDPRVPDRGRRRDRRRTASATSACRATRSST